MYYSHICHIFCFTLPKTFLSSRKVVFTCTKGRKLFESGEKIEVADELLNGLSWDQTRSSKSTGN